MTLSSFQTLEEVSSQGRAPRGRAPGGPPFFRGRAPKGKNPNIFGFFGIFMIFFVFDTLGLCLRVLGSYLGVNGTEHKDFKIFRFFRFHRVPPMLTVKCYFRGAPPEKGRALRGAPLTGNPAIALEQNADFSELRQ